MAADFEKESPDLEEEADFTPDLVTLQDEEGVEHEFEILDALDLEEGSYRAMIPVLETSLEEDSELLILKVVPSEEEEDMAYLEYIDNEEEFNRISAIFMERLEQYFDFKE